MRACSAGNSSRAVEETARREQPILGAAGHQVEGGCPPNTTALCGVRNHLSKDRDTLLAFYDFPGEHWKHLRTTNPIESTFATVRHRTIRSKGCLSNRTALAMVSKLACVGTKARQIVAPAYFLRVVNSFRGATDREYQ
jgi:hypothetical protein